MEEAKKETVVGIFQKNKNFGFVVPDNKSFETDIFIAKKDFGKARNNHKVVVEITKYPSKGRKAEGKVIEVIGNVNEAGVDMLSLIKEHNLPARFPKEVVLDCHFSISHQQQTNSSFEQTLLKSNTSKPISFNKDFLFILRGKNSNLIMFIGYYSVN